MFKLMEYFIGKKVQEESSTSNSAPPSPAPSSPKLGRSRDPPPPKSSSSPPPKPIVPEPEKPKFTKKERAEIRCTLTKFEGSEAHQILLKQLAAHELQNIVNDESDSEESENYGTFCIKDVKNSNSSSSSEDFGTFNIKNVDNSDESCGTMCVSSFGDSGSSPDFSNMFREPEEWEKYILALEKGEWVDGMAQNGAFKRWKKDRPTMPSAYLRESPIKNMLNNSSNNNKKK